jgi:hypothetical protein
MRGWRVYIEGRPSEGKRLFLSLAGKHGDHAFIQMSLHAVPEGVAYETPTLSESREEQEDGMGDVTGFLQAVLEAAWQGGLRPRGFKDTTDQVAALQDHLKDMRRIALKNYEPIKE